MLRIGTHVARASPDSVGFRSDPRLLPGLPANQEPGPFGDHNWKRRDGPDLLRRLTRFKGGDVDEIDQATRRSAQERADEGARLAHDVGLQARAATCSQATTTARAILRHADEIGANAVVMESRGLTGLKELLIGSVSHEVIQHADRTVIVVPSPEVAAHRAKAFHEEVE